MNIVDIKIQLDSSNDTVLKEVLQANNNNHLKVRIYDGDSFKDTYNYKNAIMIYDAIEYVMMPSGIDNWTVEIPNSMDDDLGLLFFKIKIERKNDGLEIIRDYFINKLDIDDEDLAYANQHPEVVSLSETVVEQFGEGGVTVHNNLEGLQGGAEGLYFHSQLELDYTGISDGQVLAYDNAEGKMVPTTGGGGSSVATEDTVADIIVVGTENTAISASNIRTVAIGQDVLANNSGAGTNKTVGIGWNALTAVLSGGDNVAVGVEALAGVAKSVVSGNTAIGSESMATPGATTKNCTAVGRYSMKSFSAVSRINSTALGYYSQVTGDNQVQAGNSSTTLYAYGAVADRSDIRDKQSIVDGPLGLLFLSKIPVRQFQMNYRESYNITVVKDEDFNIDNYNIEEIYEEDESHVFMRIVNDGSKSGLRMHNGVIAQEVKAVMDEMNIDFAGYLDASHDGRGDDILSIKYTEFVPILIKAVQELEQDNKQLRVDLDNAIIENTKLEARIKVIEDSLNL